MRLLSRGWPSKVRVGLGVQVMVMSFMLGITDANAGTGTESAAPPRKEGHARLTWQDIVRLVDNHPRLRAGQHNVAAARAGTRMAEAVPNPSIEATIARGSSKESDEAALEWGLQLTVPLGWIAQRGYRVDAASAELDVTRAEADAVRREVLLELSVLFWNLAHDEEVVFALETLEGQAETLARTVRLRVDKGDARPVEAVRAEVELEKVRADLSAVRSSMRSRGAQLRLWLGGNGVQADADFFRIPSAPGVEALQQKAITEHPSVRAAQARVRARAADVRVERSARIPTVALKAFVENELDKRAFGGGVEVDLPLWNWNSGAIAQAEARLAAARKQLEGETRQLESSVIEMRSACVAASETAERFKTQIIPRSESAASTTERTYQLGETSLLEAIDARRVLVETRRQYLAALVQAHLDCSQLTILFGKDAP